jgi:hypothetical protein
MTGPEHYREAERLLARRPAHADGRPDRNPPWDIDVAQAQVHATLALAAATALIDEKPRSGSFDAWHKWQQVAGVPPEVSR